MLAQQVPDLLLVRSDGVELSTHAAVHTPVVGRRARVRPAPTLPLFLLVFAALLQFEADPLVIFRVPTVVRLKFIELTQPGVLSSSGGGWLLKATPEKWSSMTGRGARR